MKFLDVPQSGSIAGTTHSHNRAGQYTRNRRAPVQPVGTGRRAFIRAAFGAGSTAWGGLTSAQRAAWVSYAAANPVTDSLGQTITLTGHQTFIGIYTQQTNLAATLPVNPPPSNVVNPPTAPTVTIVQATPVITVAWTAGAATDFALIAFSRQMSAGRTFNATYWQGAHRALSVATANYSSQFIAQFGAWAVGQLIFVKITPVNQYGVSGVPIVLPTIST